jgi:hypothetical protein
MKGLLPAYGADATQDKHTRLSLTGLPLISGGVELLPLAFELHLKPTVVNVACLEQTLDRRVEGVALRTQRQWSGDRRTRPRRLLREAP